STRSGTRRTTSSLHGGRRAPASSRDLLGRLQRRDVHDFGTGRRGESRRVGGRGVLDHLDLGLLVLGRGAAERGQDALLGDADGEVLRRVLVTRGGRRFQA